MQSVLRASPTRLDRVCAAQVANGRLWQPDAAQLDKWRAELPAVVAAAPAPQTAPAAQTTREGRRASRDESEAGAEGGGAVAVYDERTMAWLHGVLALGLALPASMTLVDTQLPGQPIVFANDAFCAAAGYAPSEVVGVRADGACRFLRGGWAEEEEEEEAAGLLERAFVDGRDCVVRRTLATKAGDPLPLVTAARAVSGPHVKLGAPKAGRGPSGSCSGGAPGSNAGSSTKGERCRFCVCLHFADPSGGSHAAAAAASQAEEPAARLAAEIVARKASKLVKQLPSRL